MIEIPAQYKNKIISIFGPIGENWLNSVQNIIRKYTEKFNLEKLTIHNDLSLNIILFAECEQFGRIVLKISLPVFRELIYRETKALEEFNGKGACKCFYYNLEDGIRILERLVPGKTLHSIESRNQRIKAFCDVATNLGIKLDHEVELPTYREILNRSINLSIEQQDRFILLKDFITIANDLYTDIENKKQPRYLLHADLHHDNILTSQDERKAIDPHGFIGERVLESSRFIEKELEKERINEESILDIINLISLNLEEENVLVCKSLFIDYVLSTCWDIEMNYDESHINNDINNLRMILVCLEKMVLKKKDKGTELIINKRK